MQQPQWLRKCQIRIYDSEICAFWPKKANFKCMWILFALHGGVAILNYIILCDFNFTCIIT